MGLGPNFFKGSTEYLYMVRYLLVKPRYYSRYPPLGLLKLSSFLKSRGHSVEYIVGTKRPKNPPDEIFITSLFTYAWEKVHLTVKYYKRRYPKVKLTLGGIYASLMPEHAKKSGADEIFIGIYNEAENFMPDYELIPEWDGSIIFSSRGCPKKCPFCAVPKLEPKFVSKASIEHLIYPKHSRVILWDNNFLYSKDQDAIFLELRESGKKVDFNQGLDANFITTKNAQYLRQLKISYIRLAYDHINERSQVKRAIDRLIDAGFRGRDILIYTLYNYNDTPNDFLERLKDMMEWGVASYPMRYTPLDSENKNSYISKNWTKEHLEMIADARRVIGIHGAFPPYKGLQLKILKAKTFEEAMELRPVNQTKQSKKKKSNKNSGYKNQKHIWITKEEFYHEFDKMLVNYLDTKVKTVKSLKIIKEDMEETLSETEYLICYPFKNYVRDFLKNLVKENYLKLVRKSKFIQKNTDSWNSKIILDEIKSN